MSDQETYGRFTPSALNLIKKARLSEEEQEKLNAMIEAKTDTITLDEIKAMVCCGVIVSIILLYCFILI